MIPTSVETEEIMDAVDNIQIPSGSWQLNNDMTRVGEQVSGIEDVKQCVYFMLNTERDQYIIYNWDYGIELVDLIGQPMWYVIPEIELRIKDALEWDERITDVTDFEFQQSHGKLKVTFTVHCDIDEFQAETEVAI